MLGLILVHFKGELVKITGFFPSPKSPIFVKKKLSEDVAADFSVRACDQFKIDHRFPRKCSVAFFFRQFSGDIGGKLSIFREQ